MKKICLAACLMLPAIAFSAPLEGLKFEQESAENKTAVQSATRALDKNDRAAYEKAIKTIQCPTQK